MFLSEPCLLRLYNFIYVWKLRCTFSRCSSSMCLWTLCYLFIKKKMCPITCSKRKNPVWYKRVQDYKLRRKLFIQLERGPALYIYPYLDMLFPWCIRNDKYLAINSTSKLKLDTWIFLWICLISKTKFVFEITHWKYLW